MSRAPTRGTAAPPAFGRALEAVTASAAHCNKDKGRITQVVIPRKDFTYSFTEEDRLTRFLHSGH